MADCVHGAPYYHFDSPLVPRRGKETVSGQLYFFGYCSSVGDNEGRK